MDCLIISGMSGAGKSVTVDVLEDLGYYCIDNMPTKLILQFVELFKTNTTKYEKVAFVVDIRGDGDFVLLYDIMGKLKELDMYAKMLFLDASDEVLINRHREKRRKHPLQDGTHSLIQAISIERDVLDLVRQNADYIVDTSVFSVAQMQEHITNLFGDEHSKSAIAININSFGFKYGMPKDADLVFDVRFLKNPYYVPELKKKTGLDADVRDYVFADENAAIFLGKLYDMMVFLLPLYAKEGKTSVVVSIGCTGGRHRSVALASRLHHMLNEQNHNVSLRHRDIEKG